MTIPSQMPYGNLFALAALRALAEHNRASAVYEALTADGEPPDVELVSNVAWWTVAIERRRDVRAIASRLKAFAELAALMEQS